MLLTTFEILLTIVTPLLVLYLRGRWPLRLPGGMSTLALNERTGLLLVVMATLLVDCVVRLGRASGARSPRRLLTTGGPPPQERAA